MGDAEARIRLLNYKLFVINRLCRHVTLGLSERAIFKGTESGAEKCSQLTCLAEPFQGVIVDCELPFALQAVFESRTKRVESSALFGLEELLLDLVLLLG